jgi:hypothetical protein
MRNVFPIFIGKLEGKSWSRREDNIKMEFIERGRQKSDWINLAEDGKQ